MTAKLISFDQIDQGMVPQAVLKRPIREVANQFDTTVVRGHDDLDSFEGVAILINDKIPVALKHYRGYPDKTVTVYLPATVHRLKRIEKLLARILLELRLSHDEIVWQRSDWMTES